MEDLRSGIEHLKQAKAHMSEANGIMSDHISKLKALEDENAELRAKLEAWIQSDDSYMKLPLDADGVPIRIGDVLYSSGNECRVVSITVNENEVWVAVYADDGTFFPWAKPKYLSHKNTEPADSWEKLEEDADKRVCEYAGAQKSIVDDDKYSCINCPYDEPGHHTDKGCQERMRLDLVRRAKKLAGIEEEERND